MNLVDYSTSIWSIVPPVLALCLAIVTRKVILSLSIGIIIGALMLADFNIKDTLTYLFNNVS